MKKRPKSPRTLSTGSNIGKVAFSAYLGLDTCISNMGLNHTIKCDQGGPHGRVVKVADFSALNHSIISPLWVRASLGARVTCGTSQVLLAGVSGGFSPGTPVFAPPTD